MRSRLSATIAVAAVTVLVGSAVAIAAGDPTPTAPPRIAFVARGDGTAFADALVAGSIAAQLGAPVFSTAGSSLPEATADGLAAYKPELVILTGGVNAVAAAVEDAIATATGLPANKVVRVYGENRYATAVALSAVFDTLGIDPAYLPVGATAPDADLLDGMDSTEFQPAGDYVTHAEFVPFNVTFDALGSKDIASVGSLTLSVECQQGDLDNDADADDTGVVLVLRSSSNGWFSNWDGLLTAGEVSDETAVYAEDGSTALETSATGISGRDADGNHLGIDDYHGFYAVNHPDGMCVANGVVFVNPAP